jgi:hypothetical protein
MQFAFHYKLRMKLKQVIKLLIIKPVAGDFSCDALILYEYKVQ